MCNWYNPACWLEWIRDELHAFFLWLYESVIGGVATLFESIPVPDALLNSAGHVVPAGVSFFATAFEIPIGLSIIVGAYIARFILRRIPLIG